MDEQDFIAEIRAIHLLRRAVTPHKSSVSASRRFSYLRRWWRGRTAFRSPASTWKSTQSPTASWSATGSWPMGFSSTRSWGSCKIDQEFLAWLPLVWDPTLVETSEQVTGQHKAAWWLSVWQLPLITLLFSLQHSLAVKPFLLFNYNSSTWPFVTLLCLKGWEKYANPFLLISATILQWIMEQNSA